MTAVDPAAYRRDGYVIVRDLLGPTDLAALRGESVALCRGQLGALQGLVESPQYKQIGNAVPVNLGRELGYSIVKFLNEYYSLPKPK